jgi:hypothetical protein
VYHEEKNEYLRGGIEGGDVVLDQELAHAWALVTLYYLGCVHTLPVFPNAAINNVGWLIDAFGRREALDTGA